MGNPLRRQEEICFCNGPLVNNTNLILKGLAVLRQRVKSQEPSCLFLMSLARFCSLDTHTLHCTDGLSPFYTPVYRLYSYVANPLQSKHNRTITSAVAEVSGGSVAESHETD